MVSSPSPFWWNLSLLYYLNFIKWLPPVGGFGALMYGTFTRVNDNPKPNQESLAPSKLGSKLTSYSLPYKIMLLCILATHIAYLRFSNHRCSNVFNLHFMQHWTIVVSSSLFVEFFSVFLSSWNIDYLLFFLVIFTSNFQFSFYTNTLGIWY